MKGFKVLVVSLLIFLLVFLSSCSSESDNSVGMYTTEDAVVALIAPAEITVNGVVASTTSRNVYSSLGLSLERVYGEVGDVVTVGQVLAVLDIYNLELSIARQEALIAQAQRSSEVSLGDARRRLQEAEANLANNTNIQIVNAQSALNTATSALAAARLSYDVAQRDYEQGTTQHVINAQSVFHAAGIELASVEHDYSNLRVLYAGGIISSDEMRRTGTALIHARNHYEDSRTNYNSALQQQSRGLEHYRNALRSAEAAYNNATAMLNASRTNAHQDIERLRNQVANAEISANIEHMEIELLQLKRNLDEATITSPIDGVITASAAKEGAMSTGLLFTIEDADNLEIVTHFREYDLAKLYHEMQVSIIPSGVGGMVYTGYISRISPAASPSPIALFEAIIRVTSVETNLRIGMTAGIVVSY